MSDVTIVITACNRPDLLKITIESFLKYNTYPIAEWIIIEDSAIPGVNNEIVKMYPEFTWISAVTRRGQIRSIDQAYSLVKTKYVFHMEDDWETYKDGAITESIKILEETPNVSAVMCRSHDRRVYHMSDEPPYLRCWGGWGHYSFNPGLRKMSDYHEFFESSFYAFTNAGDGSGLQSERKINDFYRQKGYRMALTPDSDGYLRHIGDGRHVGEQLNTQPIKIGLCMIVKNEAHIIHESLTATLPLIDTYCIIDTGSSDNTIEVIKKFYQEKGIPGEVHEREWKNFGHNRSEAMSLCDGKMDYILVIDADDLIAWNGDGKGDLLRILQTTPNGVEFNIRQGDLSYTRLQMFKANDSWKYVGVLHEYPSNGKPNNKLQKCPPSMYMTSRRLGGRNKVADKMKRDIAVLLKGLEEEPDNERYVFYLAQSYRDDGQIEEAVKWYKKRYEMGRWYEEQYISAYNVAKLTHDKEWVWKAHECNPKRIECLVSYMSYCRMTNKFSKELLAMGMYAASVTKPTDQHLFLENDVYDWKVWDELSIIAFYCGAKHISKMASEKLISDNKAPAEQMARIRNNYKFSL